MVPTTFPLDNGGSVTVDVEERPGMERVSRSGEVLQDARRSFEASLAEVREAAASAMRQFQSLAQPPDEVSLRFGVRLDAEVGAVIAKSGVEGHFEVTIKWTPSPAGP